jgi:hypothetical protein
MTNELSHEGEAARRAVIDEIYRAFEGVTRKGGVSWSESEALDLYMSEEECQAARESDRETDWRQLVNNREWQPFPGVGGFTFLNEKGLRYYLPVAMVRFARGEVSEWFPSHFLGVMSRLLPADSREATRAHLRATARFVEFMAKFDPTGYREPHESEWEDALRQVWAPYLSIEVDEPRRKRVREVK